MNAKNHFIQNYEKNRNYQIRIWVGFIVAHRLSTIQSADKIVVVGGGVCREMGTLNNPGVITPTVRTQETAFGNSGKALTIYPITSAQWLSRSKSVSVYWKTGFHFSGIMVSWNENIQTYEELMKKQGAFYQMSMIH